MFFSISTFSVNSGSAVIANTFCYHLNFAANKQKQKKQLLGPQQPPDYICANKLNKIHSETHALPKATVVALGLENVSQALAMLFSLLLSSITLKYLKKYMFSKGKVKVFQRICNCLFSKSVFSFSPKHYIIV